MSATRSTGAYALQPAGYRAFIPEPLPPKLPPLRDAGLQALLSRAETALGRLDGAAGMLPDPESMVHMYVCREAVLSCRIEGTQATLDDVIEAEAGVRNRRRPRDVDEVLNHIAALEHGLAGLREAPLSLRLLRECHGRLMRGAGSRNLNPGEFRTVQNFVGVAGTRLQDAAFVPPPPGQLPGILKQFERFLQAAAGMPGLIRTGLAHAQFETIHPFLDGNGRLGRLLIAFLLCRQQGLGVPVLYLSRYLLRRREEYYGRLQATREPGDLEGWLRFFLTGVAEIAGEAEELARRIVSQREELRAQVMDMSGRGAGSGLRLLARLYRRPVIGVQDAAGFLGMSNQPTAELVSRFEAAGILTEITGHRRNRRFRFAPYLALFADEPADAGAGRP